MNVTWLHKVELNYMIDNHQQLRPTQAANAPIDALSWTQTFYHSGDSDKTYIKI